MIVQGQMGNVIYGDYSGDGRQSGYRIERPWWADVIQQGIDVTGQAITGNRGGRPINVQELPPPQSRSSQSLGSVGLGGITLSPTILLLIGGAAALILFGKTRR